MILHSTRLNKFYCFNVYRSTVYTTILSLSYPLELLPPPHISAFFTSFHISCSGPTVHGTCPYRSRPLCMCHHYSFLSKHVPLLFLSLLLAPLSLIHLTTFCTCRPPLPLPLPVQCIMPFSFPSPLYIL